MKNIGKISTLCVLSSIIVVSSLYWSWIMILLTPVALVFVSPVVLYVMNKKYYQNSTSTQGLGSQQKYLNMIPTKNRVPVSTRTVVPNLKREESSFLTYRNSVHFSNRSSLNMLQHHYKGSRN